MPYNEELADRVRRALAKERGVTERKMFGGIAFMVNGSMACGIVRDELMVRVGPDQHAKLASAPGTRLMDYTGRPMKGFLFVDASGYTGRSLGTWVKRCLAYSGSLPSK